MPLRQKVFTQIIENLRDYFDVDDGQREVPVNMTLTADGFLSKDYGIETFTDAFADPITSVKNFKKKNGTRYFLLASGTKVYKWDFTKNKPYPIPASQANIAGTVAVTQGSTAVVGTGTSFTSALTVGDTIEINGETCIVATITDNLNLVLDANVTQTSASGLTLKKNTDKTFTTGGYFGWIEYLDDLYFGNAIDDYSKFDGTVVTSYGTLPKGNIFEVFEDRIFVSGVTAEPRTIYYSNAAAPTTFPVQNVLNPLGTDNVTGLANYYATLIIFKRNTLWKMTFVYDQVAAAFLPKLELLNRNYGCSGFRAYSWVENDIWFFTGKEIRAVGFRDQQTGVLGLDPSVISNDIKETLKILNQNVLDKVVLFYNDRKVYVAVPFFDRIDTVFVSHLLYKNAWTKIKGRKKSKILDIEAVDNDVYFASSEENKAFKWSDTYNDVGSAISCYVNFKEFENKDFSQTNVFRYIDLKFKNIQTRVNLTLWNDFFDVRSRKEKSFFIGTEAEGQENSLGEIPFGENLFADAFGEDVSASNFVKKRISTVLKGTVLQVGLSNNILDESFTIAGLAITGYDRPRRYFSINKISSI